MMKHEWDSLSGMNTTPDEYEKIELVYMYYPGITRKEQLASLFQQFGWPIINDMTDRALQFRNIEEDERKLQCQLNGLKEMKQALTRE